MEKFSAFSVPAECLTITTAKRSDHFSFWDQTTCRNEVQ